MMMNGDQFTSAAVSDRGLNVSRPQNEDSYLELRQYGVFAVADGVGGAQAGEVASQMAVEIIGEAFINLGDDSDPEDTMRIAIERANGAIFQMSQDLPQLASMATTLVALHVAGDIATIAHVGDSRVYRVDASGRLFRETDDHSVVEEEVRAGRMTPEQALVHPSRNVISRALGAEDTVDPEIKMLIVHPATTFLLCSDGITRHIDDSEIETLLASDSEPSEICTKMKEICYGRGAEDNLTAVVVKFPGEKQAPVKEADSDSEQVTLAAARPPFDSIAETGEDEEISIETIDIAGEIETAEIEPEEAEPALAEVSPAIEENDDGAYLLENPEEIFADEPLVEATDTYTSSSVIVPAQEEPTADPEPSRAVSSYESPEGAKVFLSKTTSLVALFIAGALIGFMGGYFLLKAYQIPTEVPADPAPKSDNISLNAFEEGRRTVDENPAKYLEKPTQPQVAEDYFLLARASLLAGRPIDARKFFVLAREQISSADPKNVRMLTNEIAMGLALLDNQIALEAFQKQTGPGANGNQSTNSIRPIR